VAYQHYSGYLHSRRRNTLPSTTRSQSAGQRGYLRILPEIVMGLVFLSFLPVWRSGLKTNLNFWQFIGNHTIFGDPVEFIPREDYMTIFQEG
jgi:hypothetical protein